MRKLVASLIGAAAVAAIPASAGATPYSSDCRTDRMSSTTYIYCTVTDSSGTYRTVTTCFDGSNTCTTREE